MPDSDPLQVEAEDAVHELEVELADFWRRSRVLLRALARSVHPDLDPAAYSLVVSLSRSDPQRIGDLAGLLGLDKSTVSRQVDAVVRLGLAERMEDPDDARARRVGLTPAGQQQVLATRSARMTRWRAALASWPEADVRALAALLRELGRSGLT